MMKTVWISGASSGIGEALTKCLDANNYEVVVSARSVEKLTQLSQSSKAIKSLPCDVSNDNDVAAIASYFNDKPLDIAIINAGTCEYMQEAKLDAAKLKQVFDINFFAAVKSIDALLPALKKSSGHLIVVSSMSVYMPFTQAEYYGASKAALSYYVQSLAADLSHTGVKVSIVYPGFVKTPLTDKNHFDMPFIIDADTAAKHFLKVIKRKPSSYAFPKALHYSLIVLRQLSRFKGTVSRAFH